MKAFVCATLVLATALLAAMFSPAVQAAEAPTKEKPIVLKFAEFAPKMVRTEGVLWWIQEVEKRTGGRVKIEYYPAESLVKARDMPEAVRSGIADIVTFVPVYYPAKIPSWTFPEVSPVSSAYAAMMAVYDLYAEEPALQKDLDRWNCRMLFPMTSAGETIMTMREKSSSLADLKGKKIRATGDQSVLIQRVGGVAVPLPQPETFTALQTKNLDGVLGFPSQAVSFGYVEVTKSWLRGLAGQYVNPAMISKNAWNKLPEDIRTIMLDVGREQVAFVAALQKKEEGAILRDVQQKNGIEVIELSQADRDHWKAQFAPIQEAWIKDKIAKGIPAESILKKYAALVEKYQKESK